MAIKKRSFYAAVIWTVLTIAIISSTVILIVYNENGKANDLLCVIVLLCNVLTGYRYRHNWFCLFISFVILAYNYSICFAEYINIFKGSLFTSYSGSDISNKGLNILTVFSALSYLSSLYITHYAVKDSTNYSLIENNRENQVVVIGVIILLILIWVFGFERPTELGKRGSPSTYYEYSLILFILGFYYSGKRKVLHLWLIMIGAAYALQNFVFGGRATGVQTLVCLLFSTYFDRIPKRRLVIWGIAIYVLMSAIGIFRASFSLSSESIARTIKVILSNGFTIDTAYSAYHTSLTFLDYLRMCDWASRMYYFRQYLFSILLGGTIPNSNLPIITHVFYMHYYGGVLPFYFYFYLGVAGIVLISLYMFFLMKNIYRKSLSEGFWKCLAIYIVSTVFRWFIYSPSQITRGILIYSILYGIVYQFDSLTNNRDYKIK